MYIRTREEALASLAEILDLPDRKAQIVQFTVSIMACLDAEPRRLLLDGQALLLDGGLDALRRGRHEALTSRRLAPLDVDHDRLATRLDAMELTEVIRQVFPEIRAERWIVARALLRGEAALRDGVAAAIRARGRHDERSRARRDVESAVASARPAWIDRAGALRSACLSVIKRAAKEVDHPHEEADLLFALAATSDDLTDALFSNPESADLRLGRLLESLEAVRELPGGPGSSAQAA
ncbi:MAG TPA: hypothetical protein VF950_23220 [Planctomycetota bacterium]